MIGIWIIYFIQACFVVGKGPEISGNLQSFISFTHFIENISGPTCKFQPPAHVIFCSLSIEVAKQDIMWTCFFMLSIRIRHAYIHSREITYLYCIPSILCRGIQVHFHILHAIYQCVQCAQRLARILNFSGLNFEKKKKHKSFSCPLRQNHEMINLWSSQIMKKISSDWLSWVLEKLCK